MTFQVSLLGMATDGWIPPGSLCSLLRKARKVEGLSKEHMLGAWVLVTTATCEKPSSRYVSL